MLKHKTKNCDQMSYIKYFDQDKCKIVLNFAALANDNTMNLFWSICQKIYPKNFIADRIQSCWYPLSNSSLWDTHKVPPGHPGCAITFSECIEQRVPMVFQPFGPSFFFFHLIFYYWCGLTAYCGFHARIKTLFNFKFWNGCRGFF